MSYRDEINAILNDRDVSVTDTETALAATRTLLADERRARSEESAADALEDSAYDLKIAKLTSEKSALEKKVDELSGQVAGWSRYFEDQFLSLNTKVWTALDGYGTSGEHSFLKASNVSTKDGILGITARPELIGGREWSSGYIQDRKSVV